MKKRAKRISEALESHLLFYLLLIGFVFGPLRE